MFGGLEIKGTVETKNDQAESGAPAGQEGPEARSGFSFLSSSNSTSAESLPGSESGPAPELGPAPTASGFSFLSSNKEESNSQEDKAGKDKDDAPPPPPSSGFSFLSGSATSTVNDADSKKEEAKASEAPGVSSFSFLTSAAVPASEIKDADSKPTPEPSKVTSNESMFSMLNLKSAGQPISVSLTKTEKSQSESASWSKPTSTKPPLPKSSDDILSLANPSQPTGSGIVFGGAAKPRIVKKRVRGKKIGAQASNTLTPSTAPTPTQLPEPQVAEPSQKPNLQLSNDANHAASRAEDFITSKQSSSSYTGRYSDGASSIVEDYGDNATNAAGKGHHAEKKEGDRSEDYKKAKAAAEEAMKTAGVPRKMGFGGGFSGFFKRSVSGATPSPASSVIEDKPVVAKKIEMNVPIYGDSQVSESSSVSNYDEDEYQERDHELETHRKTKQMNEEEYILKRQEEDRLRLEAEQKAAEQEIAERQRLEDARLAVLEAARIEEEHRKKEEEKSTAQIPVQKLHMLLNDFSTETHNASLSVANLRKERLSMLEKRSLIEKQERLASQQISQAEKQQTEAAEQEDFELADQLAAVIEHHMNEQAEKSQMLSEIECLMEDLDDKKVDTGKSIWMCFNTVQKNLEEFLKEQENSDIKNSSDLWEKFETATKTLAAENERLTADFKNIERDEGFVKEERSELESKISEETSGLEDLFSIASEKLAIVNNEIEDLRRQLEAKEMEAAEIKMEMHGHEESIDLRRSKFSRQLARLKKKEHAAEESRKEWDVEKSIYNKHREEHESEVTAHSEALIAHDNIIAEVKSEIHLAGELAKIIVQEVVVKKTAPEDSDEELLKIQAEVLSLEAAADEANQVLNAVKLSIDTLKEEVSIIEVRLPILESEKKLAAAKRDFKAAAKASKEIKAVLSRRDTCKDDLKGGAQHRLEAAIQEVESRRGALHAKKAIAHEKEKKGGTRRMVRLAERIINLEKLRGTVCGTDEEKEHSIKSVGGFVLDSEISALMIEGDCLDKKYGGWDNIMLDYASKIESEEGGKLAGDDEDETSIILEDDSTEPKEYEVENDGTQEKENDCSDDINPSKESMMKDYKNMMDKLKHLDSQLETAIEIEDYDQAAELDDTIASFKRASECLDLTDEEKEIAMQANESDDSSESKGALDVEENDDLSGEEGNEERGEKGKEESDFIKGNNDSLEESRSNSVCTDGEIPSDDIEKELENENLYENNQDDPIILREQKMLVLEDTTEAGTNDAAIPQVEL